MNDKNISAGGRPFWPGGGRGEALERIRAALMLPDPLVLLTGSPEVGKTRLVRELAAGQTDRGAMCAVAADAGTAMRELAGLADRVSRKASPLAGMPDPEAPAALLVVDGADTLDGAALERIVPLARGESISLLLAGRTGPVETLVRSASGPVRGAITARVHLDPLDERSAEGYIAALLAACGGAAGIDPDAVRRIVARSGGMPGEIERLAADAIMLARAGRAVRVAAATGPAPDFPMFRPLDLAPPVPRTDPSLGLPAARRSMQEVLEDLRTRPATAPRAGAPEGRGSLPDEPARDLPSAGTIVLPAPSRGRTVPWATGIALAVAATAFIASEPKYDVPTVHVSDNPHAVVVSSVVPEPVAGIRAAETAVMVAELEDGQPAPEEPPRAEDPAPQQPALQEPIVQEPVIELPMPEEPVVELPAFDEPTVELPMPEESVPLPPELQPTLAEPQPEPVPEQPAPAPVVAVEPPPAPPLEPPPPPRITAQAEKALMDRGDRLLALGDIAAARLLFETAATQGSARGALAAGRTLDPDYLHSLGVRGVAGDPEAAAAWYRRAADLGEPSATALLESLGRR